MQCDGTELQFASGFSLPTNLRLKLPARQSVNGCCPYHVITPFSCSSPMHTRPYQPTPLQCLRTGLMERIMGRHMLSPCMEHAPCLCNGYVHLRKEGVHIRRLSFFSRNNFTAQFFAHLFTDSCTFAASRCIAALREQRGFHGL